MITAHSIQEVREQADIIDVVGHFLNLKKRGSNYIANCPFHNEKTPSFNVNSARGIFKCFGCGKAGDAVTFVQEYEKFTFVEAIKWLADYYNITIEETGNTEVDFAHKHIEESLRIVNEYATQYFQKQLLESKEGVQIGLSYFQERGFSVQTIEKFRLGYAIDSWSAFYDKAKTQGYSDEILIKSGLISDKNNKRYDGYRGRVIFPIISNTGKVLGFGARILKNNVKAPKYINTPENEIYNKSRILYGLYQSRTQISKLDECFLVEGYTDVISLHQSGVENVVASSGTSLTEGQLKLIKNLSKNLTILYDGDTAGIKAAVRGMEMALSNRFNVQIVLLPDGEDPDSYVQKNGADALLDYIANNKKNVIDFSIHIHKDMLDDAIKKSQLANDIANTIAHINKAEDFVIQQAYIKSAAQQLNIEEQGLINLVNKNIRTKIKQQNKASVAPLEKTELVESTPTEGINIPIVDNQHIEEWKVVEVILRYGDKIFDETETVSQHFFDTYDLDLFQDELAVNILYDYHQQFSQGKPHEDIINRFIQNEDKIIQVKSIDLLLDKTTPNPKWQTQLGIKHGFSEDLYLKEAQSAFAYFELHVIQKMIAENLEEIKNTKDNPQEIKALMSVHSDLKKREKNLLNIVVKR